ncbi:putative ester cyclase [Mycobacterium frederiksbergense]|uniref:Ester cyclase n=1 Tax=Mycolicibacterium frederiksbergense TaxID=117567 RepID=A0ABT6L976_9MYCO|nr:ester cyclase [Mycolicibacterium frederiksbergense]MDH6199141.1 putative ester cyclase [Mycolicibacterium frederiksbergense]
MAVEQHKAIARRVWEVFVSGDLNELDELVAPGAAFHDTQDPFGDQRGPQHMRSLIEMYRKSFSNMKFDVKMQIAEGDYVCTLLEAQGDNTGEIMGQPPTGKHARINLTDTTKIVDGKIAENWVTWDTLGMLQQLGLVPAGAQRRQHA